jgi:hypothetical protein
MTSNGIALELVKDGSQVQTTVVDDVEYAHKGHVAAKYMGTATDKNDMSVLGREQVLRV